MNPTPWPSGFPTPSVAPSLPSGPPMQIDQAASGNVWAFVVLLALTTLVVWINARGLMSAERRAQAWLDRPEDFAGRDILPDQHGPAARLKAIKDRPGEQAAHRGRPAVARLLPRARHRQA